MAGKQISESQLTEAVKAYCISNLKQSSQSEEKPNKITIFDGTPQPGDPMLWLEDGLFRCSDTDFGMRFAENYLRPAEQPKVAAKMDMPAKPRNGNGGALVQSWRDVQVSDLTLDDIKQYICPTATDSEAFTFLKLCQARGLNPFLKEAYLIKYASGGAATVVVGKDAFTRRAEMHPKFDGFRAGVIVQSGDEIIEREGTFLKKGEDLLGGWAEGHRKDRKIPLKHTVSRSEYDTGKSNWQKMPATMVRKVALVQMLRELFSSEFSGMYDGSEVGLDPAQEVA